MIKLTEIDWLNHFNDFTYDYALTGISVTKWVESNLPDMNASYARRKIRKVDAQEVIDSCDNLASLQQHVMYTKMADRMKKQFARRFKRSHRTGRW